MEIKKGIPVSPGFAIGRAFILYSEDYRIPERSIAPEAVEGEIGRLERAYEVAVQEISRLRDEAGRRLGFETARIFDVHHYLLKDATVRAEIERLVREDLYTVEYSTSRVFRKYVKALRSIRDDYFAHRDADIRDVERRLLRALLGAKRGDLAGLREDVVIIARDLTPSQTASLDKSKIRGFATDAGGPTSHTAIVAKALEIPAVVGIETITSDVTGGDMVIVDGQRGLVIVDPDEATLQEYRGRAEHYRAYEDGLIDELKDLPAETLDGHPIALYANIDFPEEVRIAAVRGAQGIGLLRTEFLFGDVDRVPSEEEHVQVYRQALDEIGGQPVTIRTLDLGGDKFGLGAGGAAEKNPFLGCRSIRYCFQRLDLFKPQLRAILRVSVLGDVRIMFPMIATIEELRRAKVVLADCMEELREEGVPFQPAVPVGVMVEVPSAAICADLFAREADFLSIGTNDLVQYTLAVDRGNERVASLYQPANPALLRMVRDILDAGHRHGTDVSMCGEMSGELLYTVLLLGMGLRSFSVTPGVLSDVKKVIRSVTLREAVGVAARALTFDGSQDTVQFLRDRMRRIVPEF